MITIAQIGCGYWGPNLLRNFAANPKCRVKWVVDPRPERRKFVQAHYKHVEVTPEFRVVLADPDVDALVISTPAASHAQLALQALANLRDQQSSALAYFDVFWVLAVVMAALLLAVLLMKRSVAAKGALPTAE